MRTAIVLEREKAATTVPVSATMGLGDKISLALTAIGVTETRVSRWLGRPCRCRKHREKLNRLGEWASWVLSRRNTRNPDEARRHLKELLGEPSDPLDDDEKGS